MLYIPPAFLEVDTAVLHRRIEEIGFATLVTVGADGPLVSQIPTVLDTKTHPLGELRCHVARANPQWRGSDFSKPALALFSGPDAYVSPSWYPSKREHGKAVPTWNYVTVCAQGTLSLFDDRDALAAHVAELSALHESAFPEPWHVSDAPADFIERQLKGIVGFRLRIELLQGKSKLSQNREEDDRRSVAAALRQSPDGDARALGAMMDKREMP